MELNYRNKSVLTKINNSFNFSKNFVLTPKKTKHSLNPKDNRNSSSMCLQKLTEDVFGKRLKLCMYYIKLDSINKEDFKALKNTEFTKLSNNHSKAADIKPIKKVHSIVNQKLSKSQIKPLLKGLEKDNIKEVEIKNLIKQLLSKDEFIKNLSLENDKLKEKLSRIKSKLKKFIENYKILKNKISKIPLNNKINISDETKKTNLSSDSIDIRRKKISLHTSNYFSNLSNRNTTKYEDNSLNHNDFSNTIQITESDFLTEKKFTKDKNTSFMTQTKSPEYINQNLSFRSTDIIPHFGFESFKNLNIEKNDKNENHDEDLTIKLNLIKNKTKSLLEWYQKKIDHYK